MTADARRCSGLPFDDARCTTPSRHPHWICRVLGKRICLFILTLNYECFLIILLFFSQSASHGGQPSSIFKAYAMAHKGRVTSDVDYRPVDGPEAYSNRSVHSRLTEHTSMARDVHRPDYDPTTENLDG